MDKQHPQRTARQNRALWVLLEMLAEELNSAGLDMKRTLKPSVDIPWSKQTVHDFLWVPVQEAQLGKRSTTELTTAEIDKVFDTLNRHLGEKFHISLNFPSIEAISLQQIKET